ncbi:hypothetical protein M529_04650 [Sphingobium ummariense RL-3]|uniref:Uncharacterized protein n=1 Tax=Sphingobium ummariense RL-3 TaxID=1346791 RepID=T0J921_9SPHN|nr:hypothetical protein M529_04650 [Sphingobium ummariense RL-3]
MKQSTALARKNIETFFIFLPSIMFMRRGTEIIDRRPFAFSRLTHGTMNYF